MSPTPLDALLWVSSKHLVSAVFTGTHELQECKVEDTRGGSPVQVTPRDRSGGDPENSNERAGSFTMAEPD